MNQPPDYYENKFADFIKLCAEAKAKGEGLKEIAVAYPWSLGDNYDEVIESLSRLADAGLSLHIVSGRNLPSRN